jgi:hypothetical protein
VQGACHTAKNLSCSPANLNLGRGKQGCPARAERQVPIGASAVPPSAYARLPTQYLGWPSGLVQLAVGAASDKFRDYYTKSVSLGGREVVDTGFTVSAGTLLDVIVSAKGPGIDGTASWTRKGRLCRARWS